MKMFADSLCCASAQACTPRASAFVLLCLILGGGIHPASAEEPSGRHTVVMIDPLGQGPESKSMARAVSAQLAGLPVTLEVEKVKGFGPKLANQLRHASTVASRPDVLAVFWCDRSDEGELYLYMRGSGDGPTLVRNVGTGEVEPVEAAAIIVRSSIGVLLQGGTIAVERVEIEIKKAAPPDKPPPKAKEPASTALRLESGYRISRVMGTADHGGLLGIALSVHPAVTFWTSLELVAPTRAEGIDTAVTVRRISGTLGTRVLSTKRWGDFGVSLGLKAEYLSQDTSTIGSQTRILDSGDDFVFSGLPAAIVRLKLGRGLHAFVSPGVEVVLTPVQYVVKARVGQEAVLKQARIAPWGAAGLAVDLF